jgi:hypothetical protein
MPFLVYPGDPIFDPIASLSFVMPGLVPGIHVLISCHAQNTWNSFPEFRPAVCFTQVG